jgi:hypothetical protein
MPDLPSGTTPASATRRLTVPILIAGVLGGLLGAVLSFAANRFIKPAPLPPPAPTAKEIATEEARHVVEEFLAILKTEKKDEFMAQIKNGSTYVPDAVFNEFKQKFDNSRTEIRLMGSPLYEFALLRETALCPDLIQFLYLEKFERGGVIWRFIMYRAKDSWRIAQLLWNPEVREAFIP